MSNLDKKNKEDNTEKGFEHARFSWYKPNYGKLPMKSYK